MELGIRNAEMRKCQTFDEINVAMRRWASPLFRIQHSTFRIKQKQ